MSCDESAPHPGPVIQPVSGSQTFSPGIALRELQRESQGRAIESTPDAITRRARYRHFCATLDDELATELAAWSGGTWNLYQVLCVSAEAPAMARSEDGRRLVWTCAQGFTHLRFKVDAFEDEGERWRQLLRRSRRALMGMLGLPETEATVRSMCRFAPATMQRKALRLWRDVMSNDQARARASFLPRLSGVAIGVLASPLHHHVGDGLLQALAGDDRFLDDGGSDCGFVADLLGDAVMLRKDRDDVSPQASVVSVRATTPTTSANSSRTQRWSRTCLQGGAPFPPTRHACP